MGMWEMTDVHETLNGLYDDLMVATLVEYKEKLVTNEYQSWEVLKFHDVRLLWREYAQKGLVLRERLMGRVVDQVVKNIVRIRINTELCGHTQIGSEEILESYGFEDLDLDSNYYFFIDKGSGHWRISDYAMDSLWEKAVALLGAKSLEEKLVLVDQVFNITHRRGDLASWFIEGGSESLDMLKEGK